MTGTERARTQLAVYRDVQAQLRATAHLSDARRLQSLAEYLEATAVRLAKVAAR